MGGLTSSINCLEVSSKHTYRPLRVALLMVQVKNVLHPSHELPAHFGNAPLFVLPWFEFVFFSIWRMVSREMLFCKLHRHHLVGKQLQRPVGVSFGERRCT